MNDCQHTCANTLVHKYRCAAKEDETISDVPVIDIQQTKLLTDVDKVSEKHKISLFLGGGISARI